MLSGVVAGVLLFVDDVDHGPFPLVAFDPMLGEEGVVLGLEEVFEEVVEDGSLALAEVLALGGLTLTTAG